MALGNNLKKKQLIPDPNKDQLKKKKSSKKKSTAKKKALKTDPQRNSATEAEKSPAKKVTTPAKKKNLVAKPTKSKKTTSKSLTVSGKEKAPADQVKKVDKPKIEEAIEAVDLIPEIQPNQEHSKSHHDQILSAYSVYIAQELYERKSALRKRYVQEITSLQGKPIQFILLTIGTERYALDIECVREVVSMPAISKTPNTPDHIQGIVNVRGNTYVVYDLAKKFQVIAQEVPRYLLVLSDKKLKSSIPLSVLPTTFKTNGNQISHSLQTIENAILDASYIKGMIQDDKDLIYYLDIIELLKNDKAVVIPENLVKKK